jgi:hypothetical protein
MSAAAESPGAPWRAALLVGLTALCLAQGTRASEREPDQPARSPVESMRGWFERLLGPREETPARAASPRAPAPPSAPITPEVSPAPPPAAAVRESPAKPAESASPAAAAPAPNVPSATVAPAGTAPHAAASTGAAPAAPVPADALVAAPAPPPPRAGIALILPGKSSPFARASEAVRQGFMAARGVAGGKPVVVELETDGTPAGALSAYEGALARNVAAVVGPLTRAEASGFVGRSLAVPTLVLSTPETAGPATANLYMLSLAIEAEAQSAAQSAFRADAPRALIVATPSPLSRRAASAFRDEWARLGGSVRDTVEFDGNLARVRQSVERGGGIVFLAADAERARLLRPHLGRGALILGTSQVFAGAPKSEAQKVHDLNGVRFFDLPWLHQPDHAATMVFPRPDSPLSAELERIYALGIDAYRVASELALARTEFELDGVTGSIAVRSGALRRVALEVEYRDGSAAPVRAR